MDTSDPATMDLVAFGRYVAGAGADELTGLVHGPDRRALLDRLFHSMPDVFRPDRAEGLVATVHWFVGDRGDGGQDHYEMTIADGRCVVSPVPGGVPDLTLTLGAVSYLQLVTGNAHAVALVIRGRLRTRGDLGLIARFPNLFDPPKP
ncbi:SCP2 sterol-binding domain-containing protein [Actinoplanes sp. G11-F43]|uniref:SCP2 sterol-binding domain-containing protein n=1 Tax=Actinoplanes sp. G11-F43 TaxID=3424130 RepID=UPI003D3370C8